MNVLHLSLAAAFLAAPAAAGGSAAAAPLAASPATPQAAAVPAAGEASRRDMMAVYEEFCLDRFPNPRSVADAIAEQKFQPAPDADAAQALHGHPGHVWAVGMPSGRYLLAMIDAPQRGCAVTGRALDDAGTRAAFDILVSIYTSEHEYGALAKPKLGRAQIDGKPATLQLIGANPAGQPRQAFVNLAVANPDGLADARMARELAPYAPPAAATPPHPDPASAPAKPAHP